MTNTVNNEIKKTIEEQFKKECKVFDMKYEYKGYTGEEKWAIISELTEQEILEKYRSLVNGYMPFIVLSIAVGEARDEFRRNEKKHHMRAARSVDAYSFEDGETEMYHPELISGDFENQFLKNEEVRSLQEAIMMLKPIQKERVIKYYFEGKSTRQIAKEEGVSHQIVSRTLLYAIENLKKILN